MHIISRFKDYYDYLQGIYGVDEKLILDRTDFYKPPYSFNVELPEKINFCVADKLIECLYIPGVGFLYGDSIKAVSQEIHRRSYMYSQSSRYRYVVPKKFSSDRDIYFSLEEQIVDINDKLACPILIDRDAGSHMHQPKWIKFPILKEFYFHKIVPAEQMWIDLSNWLSKPVVIPDTMTNKEKILSHGFDLKESFRNIK